MLLDSKLALAIGKSLSDLCSSPSPISMTESAGTHRDVIPAGLESPGEFQHKGLFAWCCVGAGEVQQDGHEQMEGEEMKENVN